MVRKLDPERREKFLNTALRLFAENGIQNTTTAAITAEAGAAAGTLFLYFPTKQDLIHNLVLRISRQQSEYIRSLLQPSLSVKDTFLAIWSGSIRWFLENRHAYRYVQQIRDSGMIDPAVVQQSAQYLRYYYDAVEYGLREGAIQPYPIDLIGGILYQDIVAVMNLLLTQPDPSRQEDLIQAGFRIFWYGIKKEENTAA